MEDFDIFSMINLLIYLFGIRSFLGGNIAGGFILLYFLVMCFSWVTLDPITPDKMETSVQILLPTIISFGAGGSDWTIKFGALVTLCVLIYSLGIMFPPEIGVTHLPFAYFFLSLDDSLFLTGSLILLRFDLVESNG